MKLHKPSGVIFSARKSLALLFLVSVVGLAPAALVNESPLEEAQTLEQQGKLKEARDRYHDAAESLRKSGSWRRIGTSRDISVKNGSKLSFKLGTRRMLRRLPAQNHKFRRATPQARHERFRVISLCSLLPPRVHIGLLSALIKANWVRSGSTEM